MIRRENDCVDCGLPCFDSCKWKNNPHYYCDECGEEETLYEFDGQQLCAKCVLKNLKKVI